MSLFSVRVETMPEDDRAVVTGTLTQQASAVVTAVIARKLTGRLAVKLC